MEKKKAFERKRIALFLALMLIFCAFATDGIAVRSAARSVSGPTVETVLEHPGAGEFFTGSLPVSEQQSVRELSVDWQSVVLVRPGRVSNAKNGAKGIGVYIPDLDGLQRGTVWGESPKEKNGIPIAYSAETIVGYIHNQDGAKG